MLAAQNAALEWKMLRHSIPARRRSSLERLNVYKHFSGVFVPFVGSAVTISVVVED